MKKVAIISPHFPPATLAGVHRARHLAKHLPAYGWRPIILRADERHYTERLDPELAALMPADIRQIRTGAIPARLARLIGIGDIGLRTYWPLKNALRSLTAREKLDAVLITGSPFYPMMLAGWIRRSLRLPVILDFQDPWVSEEGSLRIPLTKAWLSHRLAVLLEPAVVRHANAISGITDRQNADLVERYPDLAGMPLAAIPIGGDPDDFDALRARPSADPEVKLDPGFVHISYVGNVWTRAQPTVGALFAALKSWYDREPLTVDRIRLNIVGSSNQPDAHTNFQVATLAQKYGVGDLVREIPQRVPYLEALSINANSDALLLIGSDEPHYSASKIYSTLMAGKPYLAILQSESTGCRILQTVGGGIVVAFKDFADLRHRHDAIVEGLKQVVARPIRFAPPMPDSYAASSAKAVAGEFARLLDTAVARTWAGAG